jgi:hypothetical protein
VLSRIDPNGTAVREALAQLQADPNLATERSMRVLKWVQATEQPREKGEWLEWLAEFFGWLAQSSRVLLWVAAAVLAALLVLYIYRLARAHRARQDAAADEAPSHVRDLDIRPESLPADIGAGALDLWRRGEHRAALALLYRGLLSRMVHQHGVPVRDSSTEGDCLTLAARYLREDRRAYAARLIHIWQRAVYGGQDPESTLVAELCGGFAAALDAVPDLQPAGQPA